MTQGHDNILLSDFVYPPAVLKWAAGDNWEPIYNESVSQANTPITCGYNLYRSSGRKLSLLAPLNAWQEGYSRSR